MILPHTRCRARLLCHAVCLLIVSLAAFFAAVIAHGEKRREAWDSIRKTDAVVGGRYALERLGIVGQGRGDGVAPDEESTLHKGVGPDYGKKTERAAPLSSSR